MCLFDVSVTLKDWSSHSFHLLLKPCWRNPEGVSSVSHQPQTSHLFISISMSFFTSPSIFLLLSFSSSWLTCNYPSRPLEKTLLDNTIIHERPTSTRHDEISERKCLFFHCSWATMEKQVTVVTCASPLDWVSGFKPQDKVKRWLLTGHPVGDEQRETGQTVKGELKCEEWVFTDWPTPPRIELLLTTW